MKKLITAFSLLIFTQSFIGQFLENSPNKSNLENTKISEKSTYENWFNYGEAIYNLGGNVSYYRSTIFPDSTVQSEFSSGMGYVWQHSVGQVLDPTSPYYEIENLVSFNADNHYTLDSVGIFYRYFRHQQSAPDTLIIQIYDDSKMTYSLDPWGNGKSYASLGYNYMTRKGSNATNEYVYLLENKDTTSTIEFLSFPIGLAVSPGEKVAATFTYIPGNSYSFGDTIDQYASVTPTNRINSFYYFYYVDNDHTEDPGYYNNHLMANTGIRYNINQNGWNGSYIPGTAWNSGIYHADIPFYITSNNVGINEENLLKSKPIIFPNPVKNNATIEFNVDKSGIYSFQLIDITGKTVISTFENYYSEGLQKHQFGTQGIEKGVYFWKVSNSEKSYSILFHKD